MNLSSESAAVVELLTTFFVDWRIGALTVLLLLAAVSDVRSHRIPNRLVLVGIGVGIGCNLLAPHALRQDLWYPLAGLATGFAIFVPLYALRAMGAGDVKLMAMVGAFVGAGDALFSALATIAVGGVLAIGLVLIRGTGARLVGNLVSFFYGSVLGVQAGIRAPLHIEATESAGKLPYAVAIATGSIGYLLFNHMGLL